jgi:hypothetical protein
MTMTPQDHYTLEAMDRILADAAESGREPVHLTVPRNDWLSLKANLAANLVPDPEAFGTNTYKGVPVHFHNGDPRHIYFVDTAGESFPAKAETKDAVDELASDPSNMKTQNL